MLIVTAIIAAASGVPMIDRGVRTVAPVCEPSQPRPAGVPDDPAIFQGNKDHALMSGTRKLNREPAADSYAALLYTEGQCSRPIVIGRNLGMNPKPSAKAR